LGLLSKDNSSLLASFRWKRGDRASPETVPQSLPIVASGEYFQNITLLDPIFHGRIFSLAIKESFSRQFQIGEKEREAASHSVVERVVALGVKRLEQKI
jgi:hypothetical protein